MVDLNVAIHETGVDATIVALQKLLSANKNTAATAVRLAAETKAAAEQIAGMSAKANSAGGGLQNYKKALTETGADARSLAAANELLGKSYKDIALRNLNSTPRERLTALGSGSLDRGMAAAAAIRTQENARLATSTSDLTSVERENLQIERQQDQARRDAARATRELTDAQAGRASAQLSNSRAREDLANQSKGLSEVQTATIQLARAEQDLATAQKAVTASQAQNRNNGSFAKQDAAYVRNQTAALEQEQGAIRGVISATEQLQRANQASAESGSTARLNNVNSNLGSFAYLQIASAANRLAQAIGTVGVASITASATLERSFADVERTFDPGPGPALEALKQKIIDLSLVDPITTQQIAEIATLGNQLGITSANIASFTQTIAEYSAVSGESAQSAATAFGKIGNLTGLATSEYGNLGSAIEYVARTSVSTEAGIQRTSEEITAIASGAGFSADAIVGLSGALASLSIPPERARGALSLYFGALNSAVAEGGPKLDAFAQLTGLTTAKIAELVNQNKGQEVFTDFIKGLSDLNNVAKTTALNELGLSTIRVDQTMRALSQNVPLVTSSLAGSAAAFQQNTELGRQYSVIQDTLASQWIEFQNAIGNAAAALGDVFNNDGIKGFLFLLTQAIVGFRAFAESPIGKVVLSIASAIAALVFVMATLIGGLSLLAAAMKLVPWALSGLGAKEASNGFVQFIAGLLNMNLSVEETAKGQVVLAATFKETQLAVERAAVAYKEWQIATAGTVVTTEEAAIGQELLNKSMIDTGIASGAATAGLTVMKVALVATGIGAAVVLVGSLIAAFMSMGDASQVVLGDVTGLSDAIAQDTATYRKTGDAITTYSVKLPGVTDNQRKAAAASKAWASVLGGELAPAADKANAALTKVAAGDETVKKFIASLTTNEGLKKIVSDPAFATQWQELGFNITDLVAAGIKSGGNEDVMRKALLDQLGPLREVTTIGDISSSAPTQILYYDKAGKDVTAFRDKLLSIAPAFASTGKLFQDTANQGIVFDTTVNSMGDSVASTAETFVGAADGVGAFTAAVTAGMAKFGDFQTIVKNLQDQAKQQKDPSIVSTANFSQALKETNDNAIQFYADVQKVAEQGSTSFATQIASIGPDGADILAGSLKLTSRAKVQLETNARLAAFFASDAFKTALKANVEDDNAAYGLIFSRPISEGGGIKGVQEFIKNQVKNGTDAAEQAWDAAHPNFPLNIHFKNPTPDEISLMEANLSGKITVRAHVIPTVAPNKPTNVNTYTDATSGKTITLPANLDHKTLTASLTYWLSHENAKPEDIQAKINTKNFSSDVSAWVAGHGPITVYANLSPTPSSVGRLAELFKGDFTNIPGNARGGLIDAYGQGHPAYASGGRVNGPGTGTSDSILARVSRGEYISTAATTNFWGTDVFDSLSRKMLPTSFVNMLGAAAVSGNSGPTHVANVNVIQHNPVTRDPLQQLRQDSEMIAAGIWG